MTDSTYFADAAEDAAELFRLQELERQLDPMSRRAFDDLGLAAGHRVLEVGPGAGSMLTWLASRVGPDGHVTGLDINPRFVSDLTVPNISVAQGDLMVEAVHNGPFDFVYARLVLMHISDAQDAVQRLVDLLKPGGALLLVDLDFASFQVADPDHAQAADFDALVKLYVDVLREHDIMDLTFARTLPVLMERAGCTDVSASGTVWAERGATPNAAFWKQSAETANAAVRGLAPERTDLAIDDATAAYDDPSFRFMSPTYMVATGRKPGG